eukprot:Colp12_sorted_trinity150504_noHs@22085
MLCVTLSWLQLTPERLVPVTVCGQSKACGFAILKRTSGKFGSFLQIATSDPQWDDEPSFKVYQCPIHVFLLGYIDAAKPCARTVKAALPSRHHVCVEGVRLFKGSYGAPWLLADGRVLAMHVDSFIDCVAPRKDMTDESDGEGDLVDAEDEQVGEGDNGEEDDEVVSNKSLSETVSCVASSFAFFDKAIILHNSKNLMKHLAELKVPL